MADSKIIRFKRITNTLQFKTKTPIQYIKRQDYYEFNYAAGSLLIIAYGKTVQEAKKDFLNELSRLWDYYAKDENDNLTPNAQNVKQWLKANIIEE